MKQAALNVAIVILVAPAIIFWWAHSGILFGSLGVVGGTAIALGRLAGLLLQLTLVLQLVLIGRIVWIERIVGYDRLNALHRWVGYGSVTLLIAHPMLLTIGYAQRAGEPLPTAFTVLVTGYEDVLSAVAGTLIFLGVIALSIPWVRRKLRYESWHAVHVLTYVALALTFGHQIESGGDFAQKSLVVYWYAINAIGVGTMLVYRWLRPLLLWYRHRFVVERVVQESPDAWSVYITGHDMTSFKFEAGQFANVHILARGLWQGHPFSFSQQYNGSTLRFTIKSLGDDTARIASLTPGVSVIIDGPLGRFVQRVARTGSYVLIGGGIGITPVRALAEDLAGQGKDVAVLYGAHASAHGACGRDTGARC